MTETGVYLGGFFSTGCGAFRAMNDVAADADPSTGAAVYDSAYGWMQIGGTSLAAPLVAGVYGLAANSAQFTDPTGDSGSAPDVTTVKVANDNAGALSFTVAVPNRTNLSDQDAITVELDTDQNAGTGSPNGTEYKIAWLIGQVRIYHWNAGSAAWERFTPTDFS